MDYHVTNFQSKNKRIPNKLKSIVFNFSSFFLLEENYFVLIDFNGL